MFCKAAITDSIHTESNYRGEVQHAYVHDFRTKQQQCVIRVNCGYSPPVIPDIGIRTGIAPSVPHYQYLRTELKQKEQNNFICD